MLYYKKDIHFEGPAPHIYENQPVETFSETEVHDEAKKGTEAAEKQKAIDEKAKAERERLSVEVNLGQEEKAKKEAEIKKAEEQLGSLSKDIENAEDTPLVLNPDFEEPENYVMLPEEKEEKTEVPPAEVEAKPEDVTAEEVAQVVAEGESGGAMASLAAAFGSAGKFISEMGKKFMEWLGKGLDQFKSVFGGKKEEGVENLVSEYKERDEVSPEALPVNTSLEMPIPAGIQLTSDIQHDRPRPSNKNETRNHNGIDLGMKTGMALRSPGVGRVLRRGENKDGTGGYLMDIEYNLNGVRKVMRFLHLKEIPNLKEGQKIEKGDLIGKTGETGIGVRGAHLHFEVRSGGEWGKKFGPAEDPKNYLPEHVKAQMVTKREGKHDDFWTA